MVLPKLMCRLNPAAFLLMASLSFLADQNLALAADKSKPAAKPTAAPAAFFEQTIQPILAGHCFKCHSHAADKIKGGLVLDSLAGALKGGDTGPALVPGKPEASLLVKAIGYGDPDLQMPPKGKKLSVEQIAALTKWVKQGAPWPGQAAAVALKPRGKITEEDRQWWAFQPVRDPQVPVTADGGWACNPIDKFIFARLKAEGLKPSAPAGREALIRRVFFDLTGLPPSPKEVDEFIADRAPDAYEQVIDRLLLSPRYGERWARHWLDLVRYAESDGYRADDYRPQVWRYRDYVIQSFNEDKPYNRFVQEQLAGDELWPDDPMAAKVAPTFLRHWIYEYNIRDAKGQWATILNDITDVAGDLFLGTGMQCARCHDHKFDPILQKDYYRLQAFFGSLLPRDDLIVATTQQKADHAVKLAHWKEAAGAVLEKIEAIESKYRAHARKDAIAKFPEDIQALILKPVAERTPYEHQIAELAYRQVQYEFDRLDTKIKGEDKASLDALRKQLREFDVLKPEPLPPAFTVTDVGPVAAPTMVPKGKNAQTVDPGFLSVLDERPAVIKPVPTAPNSTGRRSELARWLTQPDNPLSTRVIANRVWQYHFGRGLVASASDFGHLGEKPSHPELLDWLTTQFVKRGWSFKQLHRLILTSATYRQAAVVPTPEVARLKDPENRLLWRMNSRRLDAEQIRDAILTVTGELDLKMGGAAGEYSKPRRTIYSRVTRNVRDPLLEVFDAPDNFFSTAQRNTTTTPTQALLLINSQMMLQHARAFAAHLTQPPARNDREVVSQAYRLTFGRNPEANELKSTLAFLEAQARRVPEEKPKAAPFLAEKLPYREGKAAVLQPKTMQEILVVPDSPTLPANDFTIEAFVLLHSTYDDASVRTIAAHWDGNQSHPGWGLGVTSKNSQNKPQTVVLQLSSGATKDGAGYEPVFSGLRVELNKPYYVAVSVSLSDTNETGVTFYLKDLANDCEPMQVMNVKHRVTAPTRALLPFTIGGRPGAQNHFWDGLIDDVRLSSAVLPPDQLLVNAEGLTGKCVGYWRFETNPGVYKDVSNHGNDIQPKALPRANVLDPKTQALVDFCHVLLNASEFLYVD
jgi:mono/diheme cytochrome c family protein